jgi:formate dehydrogenase subunit beta
VVSKVMEGRTAKRDQLFADFSGDGQSLDNLKKGFSTCIRCMNCMESCPICYCKTCIFKTPTFDHASDKYAEWSLRKGVQKMPSETMLFHLTRLNHMSTSCIGCGLCDTACPMGLPVTTLFRQVAQGVQSMMDYTPGASVEDPIPLSVFREDELQDESGAKD